MRKTESGGKTRVTMPSSSLADCRSWPKGFSMTARRQPPSFEYRPAAAIPPRTVGNSSGGIAK